MFAPLKKGLLTAGALAAILGTYANSPQVQAEDPPPPKAAEIESPTGEHHVLNSSPVLDRKHSDSAATEARIRKARRYYTPYVYRPNYYYFYYPNVAPGIINGPTMYLPDPLNGI